MLYSCPHAYYLHYYASKNRRLPNQWTLQRLRYASSRYLRCGNILHWAIEWYLKESAAGRNLPSPDRLSSLAVQKFQRDQDASRNVVLGRPLPPPQKDQRKDPVLLLEYLTGDPQADDHCAERAAEMAEALHRFATDPALDRFRAAARTSGAVIERLEDFVLPDFDIGMYAKIDLLYHTPTELVIVDWKSGKDADSESRFQLAAYVLWGVHAYAVPAETIQCITVYLRTGRTWAASLDPLEIDNAIRTIDLQVQEMVELHSAGLAGHEHVFLKNPSPKRCRLCSFLPVCSEGRAVAGSDLIYPWPRRAH